ncbi:MAG: FGGY-family carbohydrate kinase [Xanthomonadales bacterium]
MTSSDFHNAAEWIKNGRALLGCELGSTRIKASLVGPGGEPLANGSHGWENRLEDGIWTYPMDAVWKGVAAAYRELAAEVERHYGVAPRRLAAAGFSAMMHGYIAVDENDRLLAPFRTWRNNITGTAAAELTALFDWPIPQRWSIAHLYQAILNGEAHVPDIRRITTLAGYVHWKLTGRWSIGVGDASGMFPVDPETGAWDRGMLNAFDEHVAGHGFPWRLEAILPEIVPVGENAGALSEAGAALLDPSGRLEPGLPLCPPEGDAGTGMVVTNAVRPKTGNVSAGTSVFAMLVLEHKLSRAHPEIDLVLTPDGNLVGMAHANNCTSDFNAWMALFGEAARALGARVTESELFEALMPLALEADPDAGGLLSYGYVSGEHLTGFSEGRPLFARLPGASFTLANFVRAHLFAALGALRTGLNVLTEEEGVEVDELVGHGGFFKTADVGQRIMAAATDTPVSVPATAGEGGSWGMALLAAFSVREQRATRLPEFLDAVIGDSIGAAVEPRPEDVAGFNRFFDRYTAGLPIEAAAVEHMQENAT